MESRLSARKDRFEDNNQQIKLENLFLILASIFIGISIFIMPVTIAPDEGVHAGLAWRILYAPKDETKRTDIVWLSDNQNGYGIRRLTNDSDSVNRNPDAIIDRAAYKAFFTEKIDFSNSKFQPSFNLQGIMFVPQLLGMLVGKAIYPSYGVILTVGRIFNALAYILGVYFILKYIKRGKLAIITISLLPMMVQQAGSLSYDVVNYLGILLYFLFITNLTFDRKIDGKKLLSLIFISILLLVTKSNNIVLLSLLLFIDFTFTDNLVFLNPLFDSYKKNRKYILTALFVLGGIATYFFLRNNGGVVHLSTMMFNSIFNPQMNPDVNSTIFVGLFGKFGWLEVPMPLWLIYIDIIILFIIFSRERIAPFMKSEGVASAFMFPLQTAAIMLGMYYWAIQTVDKQTVISLGTQGRYLTPFLIFLLPLNYIFHDKVKFKISNDTVSLMATSMLSLNFIVYFYLIVMYYWT